MSKNSTLKDNKVINKKTLEASKKTIALLKMLARSYRVDKSSTVPVNEIYVN